MKSVRDAQARRATELHMARSQIRSTTLHVMSIAIISVSAAMFITALLERATTDQDTGALFISGLVTVGLGASMWWVTAPGSVRSRDVFAAVGWTWIAITVIGALPYVLAHTFAVPGVGFTEELTNSIFESASGFSCTGSSALTDFSRMGRGLAMYRQATQFYGGMGIVVLAVAVLPFLGVGGLDLMTAEAPGPSSDRLTPRVSETAKRLWATYALLTVSIAVALIVLPGPSVYDGIAHSMSAASTGGFSPHSSSIGYFDSVWVEIILMAGMLVGGANFALHWRALVGDRGCYSRDPEFRAYVLMIVASAAIVVGFLWLGDGMALGTAARVGIFNTVSLGTSTGYGSATGEASAGNFVLWAPAAQMVLLFLMLIGASTGSTSGGVKIMRLQVLAAHSIRSIRRSQHPRAVIPVRHGSAAVSEDIVTRMAGFFVVYLLLILFGVVSLTLMDSGFIESVGAIVGALGGMGPSLGEAGPTASFSDPFSQPARLFLSLYMLIGRLEIFPILLMFAAPWRAVRDRVA